MGRVFGLWGFDLLKKTLGKAGVPMDAILLSRDTGNWDGGKVLAVVPVNSRIPNQLVRTQEARDQVEEDQMRHGAGIRYRRLGQGRARAWQVGEVASPAIVFSSLW